MNISLVEGGLCMNISSISISGFKAIRNAEFEPGNVNVLVGANGAGKSTFLEAIGLLSLAMSDRIDNASLFRKGIRLSTPSLYKSSFKDARKPTTIDLSIKWCDNSDFAYNVHLSPPSDDTSWRYHSEIAFKNEHRIWGRSGRSKEAYDNKVGMLMLDQDEESIKDRQEMHPSVEKYGSYAIYQPSTSVLRGNSPDPVQASPVGLSGGRLSEAIAELLHLEEDELMFGSMYMDELLELIDWADSFTISAPKKSNINEAVSTSRRVIEFCDRYMKETDRFTAYDASEGSLYVLFLLSLAMHKNAPDIFAIDNFDQAMNPRLAKAVTRIFCELIEEQNKTVFLTTHNPLVLDGLDLSNPNIRLFTVERDRRTGEAKIKRIVVSKELIEKNMPLSRLWINGLIGGVPNII